VDGHRVHGGAGAHDRRVVALALGWVLQGRIRTSA
jgi:hypothetical protein